MKKPRKPAPEAEPDATPADITWCDLIDSGELAAFMGEALAMEIPAR